MKSGKYLHTMTLKKQLDEQWDMCFWKKDSDLWNDASQITWRISNATLHWFEET